VARLTLQIPDEKFNRDIPIFAEAKGWRAEILDLASVTLPAPLIPNPITAEQFVEDYLIREIKDVSREVRLEAARRTVTVSE